MTELIKIVTRYGDYRVIKGYSRDFFPNKPSFHLELITGKNKGRESLSGEDTSKKRSG